MLKIALAALILLVQTSIYSYKVDDVKGDVIDFGKFRNKKVLIVNIATGSGYAAQLQKLQQLYDLHKSDLVVIGFPSNSFGYEPGDNSAIKNYCSQQGVRFPIASKAAVDGGEIQPVYQWLTSSGENTVSDGPVVGDFQKFLINENGQLIGIFGPSVDPLSDRLLQAIDGQQ